LGLITNGAPDIQWKKINGANLKEYFDRIIISGEHGIGKPDPLLFDRAFSELKTSKSNSIMVGESLSTDIRSTNQTGLKCIWLNRLKQVNDSLHALPNFEVESLIELEILF
jgi:putative hydrolase of the HAD superfamily